MAGALVYAVAGAVLGAQNVGWLGAGRDANALLPVLGVGAGLVVAAVRSSSLHDDLRGFPAGRVGGYLAAAGAVLFVFSWLIEFAIFGTLTLGLGLVCVAWAFWARRVGTVVDRGLATLSAIASLTWNTETTSAFLLVGVGLAWAVLVLRLLAPQRRSAHPGPS